jgi:hypothetical protein
MFRVNKSLLIPQSIMHVAWQNIPRWSVEYFATSHINSTWEKKEKEYSMMWHGIFLKVLSCSCDPTHAHLFICSPTHLLMSLVICFPQVGFTQWVVLDSKCKLAQNSQYVQQHQNVVTSIKTYTNTTCFDMMALRFSTCMDVGFFRGNM